MCSLRPRLLRVRPEGRSLRPRPAQGRAETIAGGRLAGTRAHGQARSMAVRAGGGARCRGERSVRDRARCPADPTGVALRSAAFATPRTRWLIQPVDVNAATQHSHARGRRAGAADVAELQDAAEHARHIDSKYGGGSSGSSLVVACLRDRAIPLLKGTYTDAVGRRLFAATAQLGRLAGYSAWDVGDQAAAQRHYIQSLRLARAAGDVPLGGYVLASMSLQAGLNDFVEDAIDMAQGAYERAYGHATPRTLAFFKLVEARAHARAARRHGHAYARRAAGLALAQSEALLGKANPGDGDPAWIDFFTYARLAADATEI